MDLGAGGLGGWAGAEGPANPNEQRQRQVQVPIQGSFASLRMTAKNKQRQWYRQWRFLVVVVAGFGAGR